MNKPERGDIYWPPGIGGGGGTGPFIWPENDDGDIKSWPGP
jgi:hypothetical protein